MNMNKRVAAATVSALSIVLFSGCTGILEAAYVARDMKKASDVYEQAQHEERVDKLNREYEEFRSSQDKAGGGDEASDQSVVINTDDNTAN
jgi:hypothetical protein